MKTMKELNLKEMELVNGGSAATTACKIIGGIGGPLLSIVGGLAFGAVMAACTVAAEVSDKKK